MIISVDVRTGGILWSPCPFTVLTGPIFFMHPRYYTYVAGPRVSTTSRAIGRDTQTMGNVITCTLRGHICIT